MRRLFVGVLAAGMMMTGVVTAFAATTANNQAQAGRYACGSEFVDDNSDGICDNWNEGTCRGDGTGCSTTDGSRGCGNGTRSMDGAGCRGGRCR